MRALRSFSKCQTSYFCRTLTHQQRCSSPLLLLKVLYDHIIANFENVKVFERGMPCKSAVNTSILCFLNVKNKNSVKFLNVSIYSIKNSILKCILIFQINY